MIESAIHWLLGVLALPKIGLTSVFVVAFVAATLLPLGSEPLIFAVIKADTALFWQVILVATAGNTLGGVVNYWIGYGAKSVFAKERESHWFGWLRRFGAKTMLLAWLPGVGDPICTLGGWLRLPFWPCVAYMALGKFCRYIIVTWLLLSVPNGVWQQIALWLA
ncbi:MAG: DedA family protein [Glaciimonas sp.]|nr:DedA family protein [Glaciimonas sp.]